MYKNENQKKPKCFEDEDELDESEEDKSPFLLNIFINIIITFALSLSIYLLIANIFLTVHKSSLALSGFGNTFMINSGKSSPINLHSQSPDYEYNGYSSQTNTGGEYYDCSKNILSNEECNLLNSYHSEYLNSLRMFLSNQNEFTNRKHLFQQKNSLKVNTSFFIH